MYDFEIKIAVGKSRFDASWKNKTLTWSELVERLKKVTVTGETHADYMAMAKPQQAKVKDIGGFVGGQLEGGHRTVQSVTGRQLITLDADDAPADFPEIVEKVLGVIPVTYVIYPTHKFSPTSPRCRLIIPMNSYVSPDEHEAIARKVAEQIGMSYFDPSSFRCNQLMYWPSVSSDIEPKVIFHDGNSLNAESILSKYPDWKDVSYWPVGEGEKAKSTLERKKQQDPRTKEGLIGAFCRRYGIAEAIRTFIPNSYTEGSEGRWTYSKGTSANGLVVYDDLFAYSFHGTDPAGGQCCNAWDLVRLHKFGELDSDGSDKKSQKAMQDFVANNNEIKRFMLAERAKSAETKTEGEHWEDALTVSKEGIPNKTLANCVLIIANAPELKGIALNELSDTIEVKGNLPWEKHTIYWKNSDLSQLTYWIATRYGVEFSDRIIKMAFEKVTSDRIFNPVSEYLSGLPDWDGVERLDTLFADYLGSEADEYTKTVTRKFFVGAVARAKKPGCKFDTAVVLDGKPGIGKSSLLKIMGGDWFTDSLRLDDMKDKTAAEKIQGAWIVEIPEMIGYRRADTDTVKNFLSIGTDIYRPAYGAYREHKPRSCVIAGTTNSTTGFLRDLTGNRKFWPVICPGGGIKDVHKDLPSERNQIWAEALMYYELGEAVYLTPDQEKMAAEKQREALERDDREGIVEEFLDKKIPEDYYEWPVQKRVQYQQTPDLVVDAGDPVIQRDFISGFEIWCECFGKPMSSFNQKESKSISAILTRMADWDRTGKQTRIQGYGTQKIWVRKSAK